MLRENPVVKKMVEMGEEQMGKTVQHLLASERFANAVQTVVANSLKAKGLLDKNLKVALAAMNLPTSSDMAALHEKLNELEQALERLQERVEDRGAAKSEAKPAKRAEGAKPKAAPAPRPRRK